MFATNFACEEFQAIAQAETQDLSRSVFERLWVHVERLLAPLPMEQKLYFAGVAIERIAQAISDRAEWLLGIEYLDPADPEVQNLLGLPSVTALDEFIGDRGPTLNLDHWLDESLLPSLPHSQTRITLSERQEEPSQDAAAVKDDLIKLTGEEKRGDCEAAIAAFFEQHPQAVSLPELRQALDLPLVEVWLGLLLGGYGLEQQGEFYEAESVFILVRY